MQEGDLEDAGSSREHLDSLLTLTNAPLGEMESSVRVRVRVHVCTRYVGQWLR